MTALNPRSGRAAPATIGGLDSLRLAALVLITWQHAASVLGHYETTQWRGISPGQTGVAIFCAIAGALAFLQAPPHPGRWLGRRLLRLFPAYWIVTLVAFALALAIPGKPVSLALFASQMLGLGYFTHGWELVNVVSWFISLILLCYLLAVAAWSSRRPFLVLALVALVAAALVLSRQEVVLSRHVLAFALAGMAALARFPLPMLAGGGALALAGAAFDPQFFYAGVALALVGLAGTGRLREIPGAAVPAAYAYEYFLVHGIALAAAAKLMGATLPAVLPAVLAAMLGAVLLHRLVALLLKQGLPATAIPAGESKG